MLDPATVIHRLGGIARGRVLQRHGISRKALSSHAAAGRIHRVRAGVFASPDVDVAAVHAAAHGGALTCEAALEHHGIWTLTEHPPVHVWLGANGRRHPHVGCTCVSHFFEGPTRFGIVSVETALMHVFVCAGDEAFFVSYESALRQRMLTRTAQLNIRAALPTSAPWLMDIAQADADSGLESLLRLRLHLLGIRLDCQITIQGVGRVDFVAERRLIIEVDGKQNHDSSTHRHTDRRRDAVASALGYETLRFDYAQVVHDWPSVQQAILAALGRARALA